MPLAKKTIKAERTVISLHTPLPGVTGVWYIRFSGCDCPAPRLWDRWLWISCFQGDSHWGAVVVKDKRESLLKKEKKKGSRPWLNRPSGSLTGYMQHLKYSCVTLEGEMKPVAVLKRNAPPSRRLLQANEQPPWLDGKCLVLLRVVQSGFNMCPGLH